MKSNFIQRTVTGVLFVGLLVGCILGGPMSFVALFALISVLTVREFGQLMNSAQGVRMNTLISALSGAYLFMATAAFCMNVVGSAVFIPYLFLLLYLMISELYLKQDYPVLNWAFAMLSQLYIALPLASINALAFYTSEDQQANYNWILPLAVFVFIWLNDTGAYCVGSLIGKHRLFERISPKKSWEGSAGGAVVVIIAACVFAHFFPFMSMLKWIGMGVTVVVFGTWGDLTESLLKRQLKIKDSGNILPGHGGMLDRFDSALMAIPATVIYLYVWTLF